MSNNVTQGEDISKVKDQQIKAIQLLFLLIPRQNAILLECLLDLLHKISNVSENRMNAHSLGMVFAPSLICPKELTTLEFHSMSALFTKAVSFMIESTPFLFKIPRELAVDVGKFWEEMEEPYKNVCTEEFVPQHTNVHLSVQKTKHHGANVMKTFDEIKLETSQEIQVAEQQIYSLRQDTSQFSNKRKFLKQVNKENRTSARKGKHTRSISFGDSLKKHFPLLSKLKQQSASVEEADSRGTDISWDIKKTINFDSKELMSTFVQTPEKKIGKIAGKCIDTPAVQIVYPMTCLQTQQTPKVSNTNNATYTVQQKHTAVVSPITQCIKIAPKSTKIAMMTPRSRAPIMLHFPMTYLETDL